MRLWVHSARRCAWRSLSLLAFLFLGFTGTAPALDSPPPPFAQEPASASLSEIVPMTEYWPAHCAALERAGAAADAIRCWWVAAEELNRYAREGLVLIDDVRELRMQWLWRGARLSLQAPKPGEQAPPVESPPSLAAGPDPARIAGPVPCASILSGDYDKCLAATAATEGDAVRPQRPAKRRALATPAPAKKKLARAKDRKPKSAGIRKLRKNVAVVKPAALPTDDAALPLVEPTPKTTRGNRVISGFQRLKSRNTAEIADWYE